MIGVESKNKDANAIETIVQVSDFLPIVKKHNEVNYC